MVAVVTGWGAPEGTVEGTFPTWGLFKGTPGFSPGEKLQGLGVSGPVQPMSTEGLLLWGQTSEEGAAQLPFQDGHSEAGSGSIKKQVSFPPTKLRLDFDLEGSSCDPSP